MAKKNASPSIETSNHADRETRKRSAASNMVVLLRTTKDGEPEIIATFLPQAAGDKSPKRAAARFVNAVLADKKHELYDDFVSGRIEYLSGHPSKITFAQETVAKF